MTEYCYYCMNKKENNGICESCGHQFEADTNAYHLPAGTVLNEKYLLGRVIGEGGFGITYIGRDLKLDMIVAVKEFYPTGYVHRNNELTLNVSVNGEGNTAFFRNGKEKYIHEARILAKFSGNKSIVDVRDFFECNNTAYIVMEYIQGETLTSHIKNHGNFAADDLVQRMLPIFEALKLIHKNGLIHRDISPDNIMMLEDGSLKLMDFGAAREANYEDKKSLSIVLKHGYAPEEQYRSKGKQGPWTDIYAACATIYKCITGITPDESTERVYSDELQPPSHYGIDIPMNNEQALMKGLAVYQKDRYQTVDELIEAFSAKKNNEADKLELSDSSDDLNDDKTEYYEANTEIDDKTEYYEENETDDVIHLYSEEKEKNVQDDTPEEKGRRTNHPKKRLTRKGIIAICSVTCAILLIIAACIIVPTVFTGHSFLSSVSIPEAIDAASVEERTFSVQENFFAFIDKDGKAHQYKIDGSYITEEDISNNSNYDLCAIEFSYRGNGAGFGVKNDGSVILLSSGLDGYHYDSALSHLNNIVDIVSTTNVLTSEASKDYAWVLGLRGDGTVANILLFEGETEPKTLHDYDSWTDIKSISFESGHPFGLKKDGTVIWIEDDETVTYKNFEGIGAIPQDMLNILNPDVYLRNDGTIVIPDDDSILFSEYWVNAGKWTDIIQFSTAFRNIIGLKADGTVIAEGPNENGQCNVSDWKNIVALKTTDQFTIGKKLDGSFVIATNNPTLEKNFNEAVNCY